MNDKLSDLRRDYGISGLTEENISKNPFEQFERWFQDALKADFPDPNAFVLSTSDQNNKPSSRVVLLKEYDNDGFVFFTNYESRKGEELAINPNAAMIFFWDKLERQIRIEGKVGKISPEKSFEYFQTRPYTSRLGAHASKQSRELSSRFSLMRDVVKLMFKYPVNVPLPNNWGGYKLIPDRIEFWQGRKNRLHDRFRFTLENNIWVSKRLYP